MKLEKKTIIWSIISVVIITLIGIILWSIFKTEKSKLSQETLKLREFTTSVLASASKYNSLDYSADTMKKELIETVTLEQLKYKSDSVGVSTLNIMDEINGLTGTSEEILNKTIEFLENFDVEGLASRVEDAVSKPTKVLTLRSNTVCDTETIDDKYCLDGNNSRLSANVYVHDEESVKWVILLHPFMTNGAVMYGTLGESYKELGYNVLAPDSRGFGNSSGKVAMGYLESLDTYDWLLDLHYNYKERYGVNNPPEIIIVHGKSLGAATTLQLATNPDIAASEDNLTKLGVKSFYDDGGYTSMGGLIEDILVNQDMGSLAVILSSLGVDFEEFMKELQNALSSLGVTGLDEFNIDDISSMEEFFNEVTDFVNYIKTADIKGVSDIPADIKEKLKKYLPEDIYNNVFNSNLVAEGNKAITNTYGAFNFGSFLNSSVGTTITNTVNTGLNSINFSKYSNSFSSGRTFPEDSKVVVTKDENNTVVPPSNSDTVVENAGENLYAEVPVDNNTTLELIVPDNNENNSKNNDDSSNIDNLDKCITEGNCANPDEKDDKDESASTTTKPNSENDASNKLQPPNGVVKSSNEKKYGYTYLKGLEPVNNNVDENYKGTCEMQVKETTASIARKVYYYKWNYDTGKYEQVFTETKGVKYINKSKVDGAIYMQWYLTIGDKKYYTSIYKRYCTVENSEFKIYDPELKENKDKEFDQKVIKEIHSNYNTSGTGKKDTLSADDSILITTANYQYTLSDYKEKNGKKKANIINDIKNKYIFTAPHSVIHWRDGATKIADLKTEVTCEILAKLTNSVCISRKAFDNTDPNDDTYESSKFQQLVVDLVNEKNIRYHIDIHGLSDSYGYNFAIGTKRGNSLYSSDKCVVEKNLSKAINKYASDAIISLNEYSDNKCNFKKSGLSNIKITDSFTGGNVIKNMKGHIEKNSKLSSIQIEITKDYRAEPKLLAQTIDSIYYFLEG